MGPRRALLLRACVSGHRLVHNHGDALQRGNPGLSLAPCPLDDNPSLCGPGRGLGRSHGRDGEHAHRSHHDGVDELVPRGHGARLDHLGRVRDSPCPFRAPFRGLCPCHGRVHVLHLSPLALCVCG